MNCNVELRVVRGTDGSIDLESCEFDEHGKIISHVPWEDSWFCDFLGGARGELGPWLKDQVVNAFLAGFNCSYTANWMANSTVMNQEEPKCTTPALLSPRPQPESS